MITAAVTKDFGVIATDSALLIKEQINFDSPKLFYFGRKYLSSGMGVPAYVSNLDFSKFTLNMDGLSIYLENYFKDTREHIKETLKELEGEKIENPFFCFFIMGVHKGKIVLAQFNSYLNFKPKYLFSDGGPKFSTIFYDEKDKPKIQMFKDTTAYMELKTRKLQKRNISATPGSMAEILTRGIYKHADIEQEIIGKKLTGGTVCVAAIFPDGQARGLSHTLE